MPYHQYLSSLTGTANATIDEAGQLGTGPHFVTGLLHQQQIFIASNNSYGQIREGDIVDEEDDDTNL